MEKEAGKIVIEIAVLSNLDEELEKAEKLLNVLEAISQRQVAKDIVINGDVIINFATD